MHSIYVMHIPQAHHRIQPRSPLTDANPGANSNLKVPEVIYNAYPNPNPNPNPKVPDSSSEVAADDTSLTDLRVADIEIQRLRRVKRASRVRRVTAI